MVSFLQLLLFGFAIIFFLFLRYFKVSIDVDDIEYKHHLNKLPSTILNVIPVIFNQLIFKYGYKDYLFKTEWGKNKILPNIITTVGPLSIDLDHLNEYLKCVGII